MRPDPDRNRSVPEHPRRPVRPLSDDERRTLLAVGDVLVPGDGALPRASAAPGIDAWLDRALTARGDAFERVVAVAQRLAPLDGAALAAAVRRLAAEAPDDFGPLSQVLAGAYLMVPEVRAAIRYPGQERRPPAFDEAAEQILSGVLDPVIARGPLPDRASDRTRPGAGR